MKKIIALLLSLVMMLGLFACSTGSDTGTQKDQTADGSSTGDKPLIGHLSISLGSDFTTSIDNGIRLAADEKGYEVLTIDVNADPELELTGVETVSYTHLDVYKRQSV